MRRSALCFSLFTLGLLCSSSVIAQGLLDFKSMPSGLIIPLDNEGLYVRNPQGQIEVRYQPNTQVVIKLAYDAIREMRDTTIRFENHKVLKDVTIPLPKTQAYARFFVRRQEDLDQILKSGQATGREKCNLHIHYRPVPDHLPDTAEEPFSGKFHFSNDKRKPARIVIQGKTFRVMLNKSRETLIHDVWDLSECRPFINDACVAGKVTNGVVLADTLYVTPLGDTSATDDPNLPRYLFIGDSISGNYDESLRTALKGKFNLHHPPTNCGPSSKGRANIVSWLGAHTVPGRQWDVISFNHGHWDSSNTKENYQSNLEAIIAELKKTNAKLVWVTTCPVPKGNPPAGPLGPDSRAPGRKTGVMEKYLNPWALEVIQKHPEISVCDQWRLVKDGEDGLFKDWWEADGDVHFGGKHAKALGEFLASHIARRMQSNK